MKKDRNIEGSENKAHGRIGVKRIISTLLITVIAVMVLVIGFLFVAPLTETHNGTAVEGSESWMSRIGDDVPISEITLPGTHDSGSEWAMLAFFTKCQSSGIRTQLDEGYRYLDIRLGNEDGSRLSLWHGFCRCRKGFMPWDETLYLEDVLADCYAFLEANPTETVVFCVKQEHGDDLEEMQRILNGKIGERPEMWCLSGSIPALGECRGKIVLLRRYDDVLGLGDDAGIYVGWEDQGGRGEILDAVTEEKDGFTLVIQDRYKYTADEKWIAFLKGLAVSGGDGALRIHFLSTNGEQKFGHPFSYAKILNNRLLETDPAQYAKSWIIVDFSDAPTAAHIYGSNFK